jgi:hypothetical protein
MIKLEDRRIPSVMLGTSPFIGAGQFGSRAYQYRRTLWDNPQNMTTIIKHSALKLGVQAVEAIGFERILKCVKEAEKETNSKISVIGSITPDNPKKSLRLLCEAQAEMIFVHGSIVDELRLNEVEAFVDEIRSAGIIPGLATHMPEVTLPVVLKRNLKAPALMVPLNAAGIFLESVDKVLQLISGSGKFVVAMKVLGAGVIPPRQALNFIFAHEFVHSAALGVASIKEANETFRIAGEVLHKFRGRGAT